MAGGVGEGVEDALGGGAGGPLGTAGTAGGLLGAAGLSPSEEVAPARDGSWERAGLPVAGLASATTVGLGVGVGVGAGPGAGAELRWGRSRTCSARPAAALHGEVRPGATVSSATRRPAMSRAPRAPSTSAI
ncbi:MAG TPA: hypothetical protein VKI20_10410, partial [Acidimicrobiales bacterium]|nr:hypothetical protein [Acidimicrobiales bacterium]